MERHELEDRIRASLQARAGDVEPTPTLWQRVSDRATRLSWWHVGAWTLSGAAAVVVLVVGIAALLDTPPRSVQIDPVQSETATEAEPTPTPTPAETGTPTTEPTETGSPTPVAPDGSGPPVVVADDEGVHEVDPATGEVVTELPVFEGLAEGGPVGDVAVRPGSGPEQLVVASMIGLEGTDWEIEISTFGPDRTRTDRIRVPAFDEQGQRMSAGGAVTPENEETFSPTLVWSADGQYLAWGRQQDGDVTVYASSWEELQVESDQVVPTAIAEFPDDGTLQPARVQDWIGDPTADSQLLVATTGGIEQLGVCMPDGLCSPDARTDMFFEGGTVIDVAHLANGARLVLVVRGSETRDAESATLELVANPMDDNQRTLQVPEGTFPEGTAGPTGGWLAAGGDRAAVGFGPSPGQLLTISGELAEDLEVTDHVELPGSLTAADVGRRG